MNTMSSIRSLILMAALWVSMNTYAQDDDLTTLRKINARFIHNFVTNDVPSHDKIIHRDFICITSQGAIVNRVDYLKAWATGFDPEVIVYWDYRDERITISGATALVRSVNKFTTIKDGKETTGMTRYTDTYVKENGEWKCLQAQITMVTPAHYPGDETIVRKYVKGK